MADMIFLAKGTAKMGMCKRDGDGNIVTQTPAQFTIEESGSCIAVGIIDTETHEIKEPVSAIYGDYDAAGYLDHVLSMLNPSRAVNIPDIKNFIPRAANDGIDICDYCDHFGCGCSVCAVTRWKEEFEENGS